MCKILQQERTELSRISNSGESIPLVKGRELVRGSICHLQSLSWKHQYCLPGTWDMVSTEKQWIYRSTANITLSLLSVCVRSVTVLDTPTHRNTYPLTLTKGREKKNDNILIRLAPVLCCHTCNTALLQEAIQAIWQNTCWESTI